MREFLFACMCVAAVVVLFGLGERLDSEAERQEAAAAQTLQGGTHTAAFENGRLTGRKEMAQSVSAAYTQGQRDAMAALDGTPKGVALAQACLAQGAVRRQP